jgi:hypothetical protein
VTVRLRHRSATARLLVSLDRIPLTACVRSLCLLRVVYASDSCDELITRCEESYRARAFVCVSDLETSTVRRPRPVLD